MLDRFLAFCLRSREEQGAIIRSIQTKKQPLVIKDVTVKNLFYKIQIHGLGDKR